MYTGLNVILKKRNTIIFKKPACEPTEWDIVINVHPSPVPPILKSKGSTVVLSGG